MLASLHGFFAWYGWPALVSIGTILLAFVTWRLAVSTRRMAREAGDETRANWRPVLVIQPSYSSELGGSPAVALKDGNLSISVNNIGRGPALDIQPAIQAEPTAPAFSPGAVEADAAAPGERFLVVWSSFDPPIVGESSTFLSGEIACRDVTGVRYVTEFGLCVRAGNVVFLMYLHVRPSGAPPASRWGERVPSRSRSWRNRATVPLRRLGRALRRRSRDHRVG